MCTITRIRVDNEIVFAYNLVNPNMGILLEVNAVSTCTFFGHRECYGLDRELLRKAIEDLINRGVDVFYVGNQGQYDRMVRRCLEQLQTDYPHIRFSVVLAYLPTEKRDYDDFADTIYPEGIEVGLPKFAIERRNRWMLDVSNYCLCYINHPWGGAYKFVEKAMRRGLTVINLGSVEI